LSEQQTVVPQSPRNVKFVSPPLTDDSRRESAPVKCLTWTRQKVLSHSGCYGSRV
jgi:hypothetical protein